jgi:hypothetical protein
LTEQDARQVAKLMKLLDLVAGRRLESTGAIHVVLPASRATELFQLGAQPHAPQEGHCLVSITRAFEGELRELVERPESRVRWLPFLALLEGGEREEE